MTRTMSVSILSVALCAAALLAAGAAAARTTTTTVRNQAMSPVHITECYSGVVDSKANGPGHWLEIGVSYKNVTDKTLASIRLRFDTYDRASGHLGVVYGDDAYGLEPGAAGDPIVHDTREESLAADAQPTGAPKIFYDPTWQFVSTETRIDSVVCSVDTVKFADGPAWHEQRPLAAAEVQRLLKNHRPGDFSWVPDE